MSYYTHVEVTMVGGDLADYPHEQQVARVKPYVETFRNAEHHDGFDDLYLDQTDEILAGKLVLMHGYSIQAEEFVRYLSECFPGTTFAARGLGEEFDDLWRFQYVDGRKVEDKSDAQLASPQAPEVKRLFTRVPDASTKGWRSFVRPVYTKWLFAALALFVMAVAVLS